MANDKVTYTQFQKARMYKNGEYLTQVPPAPTMHWSQEDWINYIDKSGYWRPKKKSATAQAFEQLIEEASNRKWPEDYRE